MSNLGRMDEREELPSRGNFIRRAADDVRSQITPPSNQMATPPVMPQQQINLGGGLGGFSIPQITLDNILANMPQGIFGYQPPVIEPEVEPVETGLEDIGVSDDVIADVVDDNTYDLGILDPTTGEVYESEDDLPDGVVVGGGDGPAGTVVEGPYISPPPPTVFSEPTPTIVDGGITTATPVVDDRNLITPNVEVPEGSMTGLGSYFTAPQIDQIVDPGYSRPATTDMDRLLQMQRQTYGNFLYAPTPAPAPSPDTGTAPGEGDSGSGYVGTGYNTNMNQGITDLYNDPTGIQFGDLQNQMYSDPLRFTDIGGYYTAYNPAQDFQQGILNDIYNRGYGVMDFPVFSGITSLVPSDTRATIGR
jgi:hypothetical protein